MAAGHYMLSGDFFENYEKFEKFFDVLEHPAHFKRYKKLVIEPKFDQPSCHGPWEDVLQMIERESERTAASESTQLRTCSRRASNLTLRATFGSQSLLACRGRR